MSAKSPTNRGRVQAQGPSTEESESWPPPDTPPTKHEVLDLLDRVKGKLSRAELEEREQCFEDAENWVKSRPGAGVDALCKKTFKNPKLRRGVRVDIEILAGKACVDDPPAGEDDGEDFGTTD